jgi:hypothetical protein
MAYYQWADRERTFQITGRRGNRILLVEQRFDYDRHYKKAKIADDVVPADVVYVRNIYTDAERFIDQRFAGFMTKIKGVEVRVDQAVQGGDDLNYDYVEAANILDELAEFVKVKALTDNEKRNALLDRLEILAIADETNLFGLAQKSRDQARKIVELEASVETEHKQLLAAVDVNNNLKKKIDELRHRLQPLESDLESFKKDLLERVHVAINDC